MRCNSSGWIVLFIKYLVWEFGCDLRYLVHRLVEHAQMICILKKISGINFSPQMTPYPRESFSQKKKPLELISAHKRLLIIHGKSMGHPGPFRHGMGNAAAETGNAGRSSSARTDQAALARHLSCGHAHTAMHT